MKVRSLSAVVTATLLTLLTDAQAGACATMAAPKPQPCSQACLAKVMADFKASVLAKKTVELAEGAEVRENMEVTTVVERMTREALDALAHRYFQTLTDHKAVAADYDEARCNRFHSGNQVTNVSTSSVEGQGARTCLTSVDGPKPWGPAIEQRFPVIDVEHGIVLGITLLMYSNQVMYVSEVFKVEQGRITHIDNIGIVKPGLEHTTGFGTHKQQAT